MRPRRVLFVGHNAELAGAEIALANFAAHLDRRRFLPSVLLPRTGPVSALLEGANIPWYSVPPPSYMMAAETGWDAPSSLRAIRPLHEAIAGLSPDVVVVNTNAIPQATIAVLATHIPLVVHLHAFVTRRQSPRLSERERMGDRMWLQFADAIVACSPWVARFYEELLGRSVAVVPNTTAAPPPSGEPPAHPPRFLMLATLEAHKRADLLIEAAGRLRRAHPGMAFECHLYGDGARGEHQRLRALIASSQVESIVTLHPAEPQTAALYRAATCAVVPSDIEPFSMVAIEAAAQARPVIATRSGGPDGIVIDGETGYLVEIGDADGLAAAMLAVVRDPARAARMGDAAYAHFTATYAPPAVMPAYEAILDAALAVDGGERRQLGQVAARSFMTRHEASR